MTPTRYCRWPASIAASISSWVSPNSVRAVLSLSVAPFRLHSSGTGTFLSSREVTGRQSVLSPQLDGSGLDDAPDLGDGLPQAWVGGIGKVGGNCGDGYP